MNDAERKLYEKWQCFRDAIQTFNAPDLRFSQKMFPSYHSGGSALRVEFEAESFATVSVPDYPIVSYSVTYEPRKPRGKRLAYRVSSEIDFWIGDGSNHHNECAPVNKSNLAYLNFHHEARQSVLERLKEHALNSKSTDCSFYKYYSSGRRQDPSFREINRKNHMLWQNLCNAVDHAKPADLVFKESEPSKIYTLKKIGGTPIPENRYWMYHEDANSRNYLVTSWHQKIPGGDDQYMENPQWLPAATHDEARKMLLTELRIIVSYIRAICESSTDLTLQTIHFF